MYKCCRLVLVVGFAGLILFLGGCAVQPVSLGISPQVWHGYSKKKQQKILANYHYVQNSYRPGSAKAEMLEVRVAGGSVFMPPFIKRYSYKPVLFAVPLGICRSVVLSNRKIKKRVVMGACYKHGILLLDPSRYDINKREGSIRFYKSPLWRHGFSYRNVHSTGFVRLKHANVTIRKIDAVKTRRK